MNRDDSVTFQHSTFCSRKECYDSDWHSYDFTFLATIFPITIL